MNGSSFQPDRVQMLTPGLGNDADKVHLWNRFVSCISEPIDVHMLSM